MLEVSMFHDDLRRKFELLEESWAKKATKKEVVKEEVKKEVKTEDAVPVAPAGPGAGTSTADVALVKTKLGQKPVHEKIKEATAEVFGDKNADNMFAGISHMIDVAAEKLYGDEVYVDFFKSLWEKCRAKVDSFQKDIKDLDNTTESQNVDGFREQEVKKALEVFSHFLNLVSSMDKDGINLFMNKLHKTPFREPMSNEIVSGLRNVLSNPPAPVAEDFHHPEKKDFPPEQKEKMKSTGKAEAERQLKTDQSVEQPVEEILGIKDDKKKTEKKESTDRRFKSKF